MDWLWLALLAADIVLLVAVAVLFTRLGRPGGQSPGASVRELEKFLAEASALGQDFDRLLDEKRELMAATLGNLDRRMEEVRGLMRQAEDAARALRDAQTAAQPLPQPTQASPPQPSPPALPFRQQVKLLASQGKSPEEISAATKRPRGEVELILGLSSQES